MWRLRGIVWTIAIGLNLLEGADVFNGGVVFLG